MLRKNYKKLNQKLISDTITILTTKNGTKAIANFIKKYGTKGLLHSKIKAKPSNNTALNLHDLSFKSRKRKPKFIYPFNKSSNLYLSYQHMKNVRRSALQNVLQQLLNILTLSRMYDKSRDVRLYTVLFTLKNCRLSTSWTDKKNGKYSYYLLKSINSYLNHQIDNNKSLNGITTLCRSNELPYHLKTNNYRTATITDVYGNPHTHLLLAVTNINQLSTLKTDITKAFHKTCGKKYNPTKLNINPLLINHTKPVIINNDTNADNITAVIKTVKYLLTDYHLQTKDCPDPAILKQLPSYLAKKIIDCQLNSTKGMHLQNFVTDKAIAKLTNKINILKRYKSVSVGKSIPLFDFNRRDATLLKIHSANGRKLFTRHHTSEKKALHRFYSYYLTKYEQSTCHTEVIDIFKEGRTRVYHLASGTTLQNPVQPKDNIQKYLKIMQNKKYLNHYLDTS